MNRITFPIKINNDGTLSVEIEGELPSGKFELVLYRVDQEKSTRQNGQQPLTLNEARRIMERAGRLALGYKAPKDYQPLTPEQRMEIGKLPPGARPTHELIDEEREEY